MRSKLVDLFKLITKCVVVHENELTCGMVSVYCVYYRALAMNWAPLVVVGYPLGRLNSTIKGIKKSVFEGNDAASLPPMSI